MGLQFGGNLNAPADALVQWRGDGGIGIEQALRKAQTELDKIHARLLDGGAHDGTLR